MADEHAVGIIGPLFRRAVQCDNAELLKVLLRHGSISLHRLALNQVLVRGDVPDGNAFYGWETKWAE